MCGRLCCYCKHSTYSERLVSKFKTKKPPEWADSNLFWPSSNITPTGFVPVLHATNNDNSESELKIRPMRFGIMHSKNSHLVHNVRNETLASSKYFHSLVESGKRCGILCDGFYEWKAKRPFFFYDSSTKFDPSRISHAWKDCDWIKNGPPVMVLAGVYSIDSSMDKPTYSCSVITKDASPNTSEIHRRIPIVLETEEEIMGWLSLGVVSTEDVLNDLDKIKNNLISFYEVSSKMNSTKYKKQDCHFPKSLAKDGFLMNWASSKKKESVGSTNETSAASQSIRSNSMLHTPEKKSTLKRKAPDPQGSSKRQASIKNWLKRP